MVTLVTTELEITWPEEGHIHFAGEWCKRYDFKPHWENRSYSVSPYHWDNRAKLKKDYIRLQSLNQKLLVELTPLMNKIHNQDKNVDFWRLVLGYWLNLYITVLFDRWSSLKVSAKYNNMDSIVFPLNKENLASLDTQGFSTCVEESAFFNHQIFHLLIKEMGIAKLCFASEFIEENQLQPLTSHQNSFKQIIYKAARTLSTRLKSNDKYFVISSYLHLTELCKLELQLGQSPIPQRSETINKRIPYDASKRNWELPLSDRNDQFDSLVRQFLPLFVPRIFIEGFNELIKGANSNGWPKNPRVIFTSNQHFFDDMFKLWAAKKVAKGTKLVVGEHGGLCPNEFNATHQYELDISDLYLSTGFKGKDSPKILPIGNFRQKLRRITPNKEGKAILICGNMPRYALDIRSMALSSQMLDYFDHQFKFVNSLPKGIRTQIRVRPYSKDYDWQVEQRWADNTNFVEFCSSKSDLWNEAKSSRLLIATYAGTTYLEALAENFPILIFWDPIKWGLNPHATSLLEHLHRAGVYHKTPESAAKFLTSIWNNIDDWWDSTRTQHAVKMFSSAYCKNNPTVTKNLADALKAL